MLLLCHVTLRYAVLLLYYIVLYCIVLYCIVANIIMSWNNAMEFDSLDTVRATQYVCLYVCLYICMSQRMDGDMMSGYTVRTPSQAGVAFTGGNTMEMKYSIQVVYSIYKTRDSDVQVH